jgi:hypothetical protein
MKVVTIQRGIPVKGSGAVHRQIGPSFISFVGVGYNPNLVIRRVERGMDAIGPKRRKCLSFVLPVEMDRDRHQRIASVTVSTNRNQTTLSILHSTRKARETLPVLAGIGIDLSPFNSGKNRYEQDLPGLLTLRPRQLFKFEDLQSGRFH